MVRCDAECEVFSRVVGYYRPVAKWNDGKKEEFEERKVFVSGLRLDVPLSNNI